MLLKIILAPAALVAMASAHAEPVKGVVELFTSQSCSSCPPADKLFGQLVEKDGVIGLAWHVDYWNYLDWKDTFSTAQATQRQYSYAKAFGTNQVYTPQFVFNGREAIESRSLEAAIGKLGARDGLPVEISAAAEKDRIVLRTGSGQGEANLVLIQFDNKESVNVKAGENSGRTIINRYAVTDMHTVGMWSGKAMQVDLPLNEYLPEKGKGCAILLQRVRDDAPGEIIGAALIGWN